MNWYTAGIIVFTSAMVSAVLYPLVVLTLREIGIRDVTRRAAEAQGAAEAALEAARELVEKQLQTRRDLQALAHEIENLKLAREFERDWMREHGKATRG
jgi:hypothetical protein